MATENYVIAQGQTKDEIRSTAATVNIDNSGKIWGHGPNNVLREAIHLSSTTVSIKNKATGVIEATNAHAIVIAASTATIDNAGVIEALSRDKRAISVSLNTNSDLTAVTNSGHISATGNGDAIVLTNAGSGKLKVVNSGQIDGGIEAHRLDNSGTITRVGAGDLSIYTTLKNTGTIATAQINGTAAITNSGTITADALSAKSLNNNSASGVITATISTAFDTVTNIGTVNGGAMMTVKGVIDTSDTLTAGRINTVTGNDAQDLTLGLADGHGITNTGTVTTGILDTHELWNFGEVTLQYTGGNNVPSAASGFFATQLSDIHFTVNYGTITADVIHGGTLYNSGTLTLTGATMGAGVGVATEFQKIENTGHNARLPDGIINGDITGDDILNMGYINGKVTLKDINGDGQTNYNGNGGYSENVIQGSSVQDIVMGSYGDDTIHGGSGNDRLTGNHGDDLIFGDGGNDTLSASTGNDTLDGGTGSDHLYFGGFGDVEATGGSGSDRFYFRVFGHEESDSVITDFENGKDRIYIHTNGNTAVDSWSDVQQLAVRIDEDTVVIDFTSVGGSGTLEINGVTYGQLGSSDFVFI